MPTPLQPAALAQGHERQRSMWPVPAVVVDEHVSYLHGHSGPVPTEKSVLVTAVDVAAADGYAAGR
jgi:hypothetical protein